MASSLDSCPALVLNADFRPLSYFPLSLWSWQDAVKAVFLDRVYIVDHYDAYVRSPSFEMRLPSVIALKEYVQAARNPAFTRFNVFLRDRFTCQYCGRPHPSHELTFDHVVPRSKGGTTVWSNVVTACGGCNLLKGNRLPQAERALPAAAPGPADHFYAAGQRPRLPAQLSARELARLPLLGYRARPVVTPVLISAESRDTRFNRLDRGQRIPGLRRDDNRLMRDQAAFDRGGLDRLLQLLEGAHLDLADPLARDAVLLRQILERRRVLLEAPLGQDVALALVEVGHRLFQQVAPQPQLLALAEHGFLALALVDQPILPLALAVAAQAARSANGRGWRAAGSC